MTFSERMKELLEQGAQVSKEFAAKAGEKAQDWSEKGYQASKDFAAKAGVKAQELGERGVLLLEVKQLEWQAQKLMARLGTEAYNSFDNGADTISRDSPAIKAVLGELASVRAAIEQREEQLRNKKE
jgi:hypothetical protein